MNIITDILKRQEVISALILIITTASGFLVNKIKNKQLLEDAQRDKILELQRSNKRIALRNEYLQIYNSPYFTWKQKFDMSREIIEDYFRLNGNHYIHGLDQELLERVKEERNG